MARIRKDFPDICRRHGLKVVELNGWETNGRDPEHGDFDPVGVLNHHTGSKDVYNDLANDLAYAKWLAFDGRDDLPAPLCQMAVSLEGTVYFCAAGRANHAGKAKASGTVAAGDGNTLYVGLEHMNDGQQGWPKSQYEAIVLLNALINIYVTGNSAATDRGHKETSVTGKWDPGRMDMGKLRADVRTRMELLRKPSDPERRSLIEKFRDTRPKFDVKLLDRAVQNGRTGTVKRVRNGLVDAMNSLPRDRKETLVNQVRDQWRTDRIINLRLLNAAVTNGRTGRVEKVRDRVIYLINSLPKE